MDVFPEGGVKYTDGEVINLPQGGVVVCGDEVVDAAEALEFAYGHTDRGYPDMGTRVGDEYDKLETQSLYAAGARGEDKQNVFAGVSDTEALYEGLAQVEAEARASLAAAQKELAAQGMENVGRMWLWLNAKIFKDTRLALTIEGLASERVARVAKMRGQLAKLLGIETPVENQ